MKIQNPATIHAVIVAEILPNLPLMVSHAIINEVNDVNIGITYDQSCGLSKNQYKNIDASANEIT